MFDSFRLNRNFRFALILRLKAYAAPLLGSSSDRHGSFQVASRLALPVPVTCLVRFPPSMAVRCGWSCPCSMRGRAPSGCAAWNSCPTTARVSGNRTATTCTATRGKSSDLTQADPAGYRRWMVWAAGGFQPTKYYAGSLLRGAKNCIEIRGQESFQP
jgi:hypothetical protein